MTQTIWLINIISSSSAGQIKELHVPHLAPDRRLPMPGIEPGPVWWRDLSGKVTRSEVQRFRQNWDALEGIQDVNIILVLLLSFITKQTQSGFTTEFFFFNPFIVQKSSKHMFAKSAVESCNRRYVGAVEDGAESPGMFDWFFNGFFFFFFWRLPQYNQVFTCQGTKRNFSHTTGWRCSLSLTAPGGRPLHSRADDSTGPLKLEGHVTVATYTHTRRTLDSCSALYLLQDAHTGRQSWVCFFWEVRELEDRMAPPPLQTNKSAGIICGRIFCFRRRTEEAENKADFKTWINSASSFQGTETADTWRPQTVKPIERFYTQFKNQGLVCLVFFFFKKRKNKWK